MTIKQRVLCGICLVSMNGSQAIVSTNFFRPFDINLLTPAWRDTSRQWTIWTENSINVRGYNAEGHSVPVTQIWSAKQDAIAALRGFPTDDPKTLFLENVLLNAMETATRGMFEVNGQLSGGAVGNFVRLFLPHNITFGVYLPIYYMRLHKLHFKDLTQSSGNMLDEIVKERLTSKLKAVFYQFDPTLSLNPWHAVGFGDLVCMTEWGRNFPQKKPALKNVFLNTRGGLSFPTGLKKDEDKILSVPFGYDGSMAVLLGAGLNLQWYHHLSGGLDFQFTYLFGNTRTRRIPVDTQQTAFFQFAKAKVYTDYGFLQRYNLFLSLDSFIVNGLSLRCIYQFFKQSDDTMSVASNSYSEIIVNEAEALKEWDMQHLIFKADFDPQCLLFEKRTGIKPQFSFFAKMPLNGKRSIMFTTVGATVTFNF